MKRLLIGLMVLLSAAPAAATQAKYPDTLIVMTVPLKYLSAKDAVELVSPYATTMNASGQPAGGVYPAPGDHAVTIRERTPQYFRMLSLLREYDRAPRKINVTYQLVLADRSGRHATEIPAIDTVLRSSLRFTGYSVLGAGVIQNGQGDAQVPGDDARYTVIAKTTNVPGTPDEAPAELYIQLMRMPWTAAGTPTGPNDVLTGGSILRIPLGQTVVIGGAAIDKDHAVMVVVRPELVKSSIHITVTGTFDKATGVFTRSPELNDQH